MVAIRARRSETFHLLIWVKTRTSRHQSRNWRNKTTTSWNKQRSITSVMRSRKRRSDSTKQIIHSRTGRRVRITTCLSRGQTWNQAEVNNLVWLWRQRRNQPWSPIHSHKRHQRCWDSILCLLRPRWRSQSSSIYSLVSRRSLTSRSDKKLLTTRWLNHPKHQHPSWSSLVSTTAWASVDQERRSWLWLSSMTCSWRKQSKPKSRE